MRTGSRGLFWLEPLVEVDGPQGRVGYGPMGAGDDASLSRAARRRRARKSLGLVEEIPYLKKQQRLTFARCGKIDPLSLEAYRAEGGLKGLERAHRIGPEATVDEVLASGLRGRGGAGFPTGIKWRTVAGARPIKNTSSATPTRATAALSPTACCSKAIRSC